MEVLKQLLGRLHPLIVHLPIGFIILGLLLHYYDRKKRQFTKVIALSYLWAGISAVAACISGYLQYLAEGYSFDSVKLHLWTGIATALFSFVMWLRIEENKRISALLKVPLLYLSLAFFVLVSFTGHLGGTITHGEDYLVEPLPNSLKSALGYTVIEEKDILLTEENWETALFYSDVVEPLLYNHCASCHNSKKAKGDLVVTSQESLLIGGENGPVVHSQNPEKSELLLRMLLPKTDDKHMPPDGKRQPSKEDIAILQKWIEKGLPYDQTIGELELPKDLFDTYLHRKIVTDYPEALVDPAPHDSIQKVREIGLHVELISKNTNYLKVSALNQPDFSDNDFAILLSIAPQIAILDLGGTQISDAIWKRLKTLPNLTLLKVDHTALTGDTIQEIQDLKQLRSINLSYTSFPVDNLEKLENLSALRKVYLFHPGIDRTGTDSLLDGALVVEYGNYELPEIASDSITY